MILKEYPSAERPRERAVSQGIDVLSNVELLAIIIRTGNKQESAIQLAQRIINGIDGFENITSLTYQELISIKGIKQAKAIEILASIEVAKRLLKKTTVKYPIQHPKDAYQFVKHRFLFEKQEKVMVLCLNSRLEVIREKIVFVGSNDTSIISGKEIFKEALLSGSNQIMIIHNHPSGNPKPSPEDKESTKKLITMSEQLEIKLLDHLIIGENCFYSFATNTVISM